MTIHDFINAPLVKKFPHLCSLDAPQEVVDSEGRQRFHGAFTGGWSAGYYNTAGSAEGWAPSTFKSSRADRGAVKCVSTYRSCCARAYRGAAVVVASRMHATACSGCCGPSQMTTAAGTLCALWAEKPIFLA